MPRAHRREFRDDVVAAARKGEASLNVRGWSAGVRFEVLGGGGAQQFR